MSDRSGRMRSGTLQAAVGLGAQALLCAVLAFLSATSASRPLQHAFLNALSGLPVWLHVLATCRLLYRTPAQTIADSEASSRQSPSNAGPAPAPPGARLQRLYHRYAVILLELLVLLPLALSAYRLFSAGGDASSYDGLSPLLNLSIYAVGTFGTLVATVYFLNLTRFASWKPLRPGARFVFMQMLVFSMLLIDACLNYFRVYTASPWIMGMIAGLNAVIAAETCAGILLRAVRPQPRDSLPRAAFDSFLLEMLLHPARIQTTLHDMLQSILGFDVSATTFYRALRAAALPFAFAGVVMLLALSSVIIVAPGSQALVLRYGKISGRTLDPGIHGKLPWPLASVRQFEVTRIRRIHVGSHQPDTATGTVFREGIPLLWTNVHGVAAEELLVVASPRKLLETVQQSGGKIHDSHRRTPSVSLAGADIAVEYVISDLPAYVRSSADPVVHLSVLAREAVTRHILRYDIDELFSEKRLAMADTLVTTIQASLDRHRAGVRVVHIGISAVHPPLPVADAFEETVTARQESRMKIQQALQAAARMKIETAGSQENFDRLMAAIEGQETTRPSMAAGMEEMLLSSGGEVSRILAEAFGYRSSHVHTEKGNTERFREELRLYRTAPKPYRYERYLAVLEKSLVDKKKIMLAGRRSDIIMGMRNQSGSKGLATVPPGGLRPFSKNRTKEE